jgi:hypothetical protein
VFIPNQHRTCQSYQPHILHLLITNISIDNTLIKVTVQGVKSISGATCHITVVERQQQNLHDAVVVQKQTLEPLEQWEAIQFADIIV